MIDSALLAFIGVSVLISITPGPDMAVVTKNALAHGRRGVFLTTAGIGLGLVVWVIATAVGLSAVLRASANLLFVLKLVGAAYLTYLGVRTLVESRHRHGDLLAEVPPAAAAHAVFRQGFLSAITNPKLGVFFVTFLPQFVLSGQPVFARLVELGVLFAVIGFAWMNIYGLSITRLRALITAPRVRQWMQRVTGAVLLGFGARLALERI